MLNLYQLQSFVTVISEGSMTGAADKLFLTQPAISQQIKNLEDELGVELLVRGVRHIRPTLQGEVLYEYTKKVLQLVQQAEIAVKAMGAELKGQIRIGTLNSLGVQLISPIVSRLLKYNPKLSIKIEYDLGENLIKAYRRDELDIVILPETEKQYGQSIEGEKKFLMKEEMWLVGSGKDTDMPDHIGIADLKKYPLITFTKEYPHFSELLEKSAAKAGIKLEPTFESTNVGTLKRVIESGLGWGFLPALTIKKQVKAGRMNRVHVKDLNFEVDFFYYYKKGSDKIVEVFFQALQGQERT
jgi:DNA-binding transcriptional LysR family regulator